jgi:hypothetical protein
MKQPQTDSGKFSLPGVLAVKRMGGVPTIFPADSGEVSPEEDMLKVCVRWGVGVDHADFVGDQGRKELQMITLMRRGRRQAKVVRLPVDKEWAGGTEVLSGGHI